MKLDRRRFLGLGASGVALGMLGPVLRSPFASSLFAAGGPLPAKKMLVIFMRGGNDGVNTVIPYGDPEYNDTNRPSLFIPDVDALDLGNGFAKLHPALSALHDVHLAGDLATIHRVAYAGQSRSHFDSQHFWENAIPGSDLEEGWLYRHIVETLDLQANPLAAASISSQLMLLFKGSTIIPHIPSIANYRLGAPGSPESAKLLGNAPGMQPGRGLMGWYGQASNQVGYDELVRNTGLALGSSLTTLEAAGVDPATYIPENGATYPDVDNPEGFAAAAFPFFEQLRDAAMLLKLTDLQIAGLEISSFDTHNAQGAGNGAQANLLAQIGHGIRSLSLDLQSIWNDVLVVTVSEFGRTSEENGSNGTDHGEASCMFVAGGSVNGGVYNCDATTWAAGDMFSTPNGRYVSHLTDFRGVLAECLAGHFGIGATTLDVVIPGYSGQAGNPTFASLGILP
ncbi:MAG: DUF1501 domain-containing protein [Planctomycetes bacterium]|nr:DUF1501 domain-containing protein [Planctomycetota bacterium]